MAVSGSQDLVISTVSMSAMPPLADLEVVES